MKDVNNNAYINIGGHAFGFIKCNDVWSYYDDNHGLINPNAGGRLLQIIKTH